MRKRAAVLACVMALGAASAPAGAAAQTAEQKRADTERLVELLHTDVVLYQPHVPAIRGRQAALQEFRRLFRRLPEL